MAMGMSGGQIVGQLNPQQQPGGGGGGQVGPQQSQAGGNMEQQKLDNISKAKGLVQPLKDSLANVFKTAGQALGANNIGEPGSKNVEFDPNRFDKNLEEFFSTCDQMELHLRTSIECINQGSASQRYLPTPVSHMKLDGHLTYQQYISTVKSQISYAKKVHDTLADAGAEIAD